MVSKAYFCYNGYVENFAEVEFYKKNPSKANSTSAKFFVSGRTTMLENNQPTTPILIEDLGYLYPTETSKQKKRYAVYQCQCGAEFRAETANVKNGATKSCGCYNRQVIIERSTTHGLTKHPLYSFWRGMITRTTNKKERSFKNYGARGIFVCDEWRNSPQAFFDWAYENGYTPDLSIDRIDNDSGYSPENCRWTTRTVQTRNTRKIRVNNTSGYRGVSFSKDRKKWEAGIRINNKQKHLGRFESAIEAAAAYDIYIIENNLEHTKNGV